MLGVFRFLGYLCGNYFFGLKVFFFFLECGVLRKVVLNISGRFMSILVTRTGSVAFYRFYYVDMGWMGFMCFLLEG